MAYNTKYYCRWSELNNTLTSRRTFRCNFKFLNYSGDSTEIEAHYGLVVDEVNSDDNYYGIKALKGSISIINKGDVSVESFYDENEKSILVELIDEGNSQVYFKGFVVTGFDSQQYKDGNKIFNLTVTDGLAFLKNQKYVDSDNKFYLGDISFKNTLYNCLDKLGLDLPLRTVFNSYDSNMTTGTINDPLEQAYQNSNNFRKDYEALNCYEVIKNITDGLRCVLYQEDGEWVFERIPEKQIGSIATRKYTSAGQTYAQLVDYRINAYDSTQYQPLGGSMVSYENSVKKSVIEFEVGEFKNELLNSDFTSYTTGDFSSWTEDSGLTVTRVGTGTSGDPYGAKLAGYVNKAKDAKTINQTIVLGNSTSALDNYFLFSTNVLTQDVKSFGVRVKLEVVSAGLGLLFGWLDEGRNFVINKTTITSDNVDVNGRSKTSNVSVKLQSVILRDAYVYSAAGALTGSAYGITDITEVRVKIYLTQGVQRAVQRIDQTFDEWVIFKNPSVQIVNANTNLNIKTIKYQAEQEKTARIDVNNKVVFGDYIDSSNVSAIKRVGGLTLLWTTPINSNQKELLQHFVNEEVNLRAKPQKSFDGSFWGRVKRSNLVNLLNESIPYYCVHYGYDYSKSIAKGKWVKYQSGQGGSISEKKTAVLSDNTEIEMTGLSIPTTYSSSEINNIYNVLKGYLPTSGGVVDGLINIDSIDAISTTNNTAESTSKGILNIGKINANTINTGNNSSISNFFGENRFYNTAGTFYSKIDNSLLDKNVTVKIPTSLASFTVASIENSWQLGGNSVGSEKTIGTIDNYDLPIIRNNTQVAKFVSAGVQLPTISTLGTTPSQFAVIGASNLIQQRAIADVKNDLISAGLGGNGTTNYLPKFSNTTGGLTNSTAIDNGTSFTINNQLIAGKNAVVLVGRYDATYPTTSATTGYFKIETNNVGVDSGGMSAFRLNGGTYHKTFAFDYRGYTTVGNYATDSLFRAYNANAGLVVGYDGGTANYYDANTHYYRSSSLAALLTISNGTYVIDATGTVKASVAFNSPTIFLTNSPTVGYVWKCTNVNGAGSWQAIGTSERWKGVWAANSGSAPSASPAEGDYYTVTVAGTYLGVPYAVNEYAYYNGTAWVARPNGYTLVTASSSVLGGIRIGTTLAIDGSGIANLATVTQGSGANFVKVSWDSYGRITGNSAVTASDIPTLTVSKLSDFSTSVDSAINAKVSGTVNYLPKFSSANVIGNSIAYEGTYGTGSTPAIITTGIFNAAQGFFADTSSYLVSGEVGATTVKASRTIQGFNGTGSDGQFLKQVLHVPSGNYRSTWSNLAISDVTDLQTTLTGKLDTTSISGTANYVTKYATSSTLGNSQIFDNGSFVGINTSTAISGYRAVVNGNLTATGIRSGTDTKSIYIGNYFGITPRITANGANMEFIAQVTSSNIFTWYSTGDIVRMRLNTDRLWVSTSLDIVGNIKYSGTLKPSDIAGKAGYFLKTTGVVDLWDRIQITDVENLTERLALLNKGIVFDFDTLYKGVGFNLYSDLTETVKMGRIETYVDSGRIDFTGYRLNSTDGEEYFGMRMKLSDANLYHFFGDSEYQIYTSQNAILSAIVNGFASATDGYVIKKVGSSITYAADNTGSGGSGNNYAFDSSYFSTTGTTNVSVTLSSAFVSLVNSKLSDGGTVNDSLKFVHLSELYWNYTNDSTYSARLYWNNNNSSLNLQASDTNIYFGCYGSGKNFEIISDDGDIKLKANKYYLYDKTNSRQIEIDMSAFGTGKVLKATSSSKAEWVTL